MTFLDCCPVVEAPPPYSPLFLTSLAYLTDIQNLLMFGLCNVSCAAGCLTTAKQNISTPVTVCCSKHIFGGCSQRAFNLISPQHFCLSFFLCFLCRHQTLTFAVRWQVWFPPVHAKPVHQCSTPLLVKPCFRCLPVVCGFCFSFLSNS